jgi:DNA-binding LacI/PurR family transcriptional regulator
LPSAEVRRPQGRQAERARPTIEDVAAAAGVSRGTVSRVLNGGRNVSPAALTAVRSAIGRTGYVANHHARSLVTQRSRSVAFIPSKPQEHLFEDPNFSILLRGCARALAGHDMPLLLSVAGTDDDRKRVARFIAAGHVDGVLLISAHHGDAVMGELARRNVPMAAWGVPLGYEGRVAYVRADDRDGARQMVRYLRSCGRRRIGIVTGPMDTTGGQQRLAGYQDIMGAAAVSELIAHGDYSEGSGAAATEQLLHRVPDIDALFVASDLMAHGAMRVLARAGRRVPEDVAVGGFDDSAAATTTEPALTTIRQPWQRISTEMVRLLLGQIDGDPPATVTLPTELVRRGSA